MFVSPNLTIKHCEVGTTERMMCRWIGAVLSNCFATSCHTGLWCWQMNCQEDAPEKATARQWVEHRWFYDFCGKSALWHMQSEEWIFRSNTCGWYQVLMSWLVSDWTASSMIDVRRWAASKQKTPFLMLRPGRGEKTCDVMFQVQCAKVRCQAWKGQGMTVLTCEMLCHAVPCYSMLRMHIFHNICAHTHIYTRKCIFIHAHVGFMAFCLGPGSPSSCSNCAWTYPSARRDINSGVF